VCSGSLQVYLKGSEKSSSEKTQKRPIFCTLLYGSARLLTVGQYIVRFLQNLLLLLNQDRRKIRLLLNNLKKNIFQWKISEYGSVENSGSGWTRIRSDQTLFIAAGYGFASESMRILIEDTEENTQEH
jgi:hypothetical protein